MKAAILISSPVDTSLPGKVKDGSYPQQDYLALTEALGATLLTPVQKTRSIFGKFSKPLGIFRAAFAAFRQRNKFDVIITDIDRVGMVLAFLLKITGSKTRHVLICHGKVARPQDLRLIQTLRLHTHIDRFVCYGAAVEKKLRDHVNLLEDQVVTIRHPSDHHYWQPTGATPERLIVSAGMAKRDYPTLIEAVRGLDVSLAVAAYSPWVTASDTGIDVDNLPPNVQLLQCNYEELRELYARAMVVAAPLRTSTAQSGSLVMYEAMAMGKPVIATRTEGQGAMEIVREGETGWYMPLGDVEAWRERIQYVLDNPGEVAEMGERARGVVEDGMNLDGYVREMVSIARSAVGETSESGVFQKASVRSD